ncbi:uncharacterized protein LACBIDRAFT_322967, partial [Laccaria bicolor S238N-H82]
FDETEFITTPPRGSRLLDPRTNKAETPVDVYGILRLNKTAYLTETGRIRLRAELRQRDGPGSGLTLERLFGDGKNSGSTIRVYLRGFTPYIIGCNDNRSIDALDKGRTPLDQRTIDWLVEKYTTEIRKHDLFRRLIHNGPDEQTSVKRHLRHVSQADIRCYFAAQAEWLLAHQLASSHSQEVRGRLSLRHWVAFCREVKIDRQKARSQGVRWGMPHGAKKEYIGKAGDEFGLARFGMGEKPATFWETQLHNGLKEKKKQMDFEFEAQLPRKEASHKEELRKGEFSYDGDFSEPSTPGMSDTDSDIESDIFAQPIPQCVFDPPEIPPGRFTWFCCIPGCSYTIDLLNLTEENLNGLPEHTAYILKSKSWSSVRDSPVQQSLQHLVNIHYNSHLEEHGIYVDLKGKRRYVDVWPPGSSKKRQVKETVVKLEEDDTGPELRRSRRPKSGPVVYTSLSPTSYWHYAPGATYFKDSSSATP